MEAKELMIGDWVEIKEDGKHLKYTQVQTIGSTNVDYYYPISLTPEILEKNGWEKLGDRFLFRHDDVPFDIGISDAYPFEKMFVSIRTERPIIAMLYVHEAQHALRLCGFDNLADNLVIS